MFDALGGIDRKKSQHLVLCRAVLVNRSPRVGIDAKLYGATFGIERRDRSRFRPAKGTVGFQAGENCSSQGDMAVQSRVDQVVEELIIKDSVPASSP